MQKRRIKHNDLTHYFIREHSELPAAYLASCEKFFKELSIKQQAPVLSIKKSYCNKLAKLQAPSGKQQAASNKLDKGYGI
jgi:hypothetical protein